MRAADVYAGLSFPEPDGPDGKPYVAINMVSTLDGKAAIGGKASPLGSVIDREIMRNLRSSVDAVLVGAGTVRAEEMNLGVSEGLAAAREAHGLPGQPLGVILAGSEDLPLERKVFRPDGPRPIVVAGPTTPRATLAAASDLGLRILRAKGPGLPNPRDVLRLLKDHLGVRALLLEGGPAVNGSFLSAEAVDELFLTLSPKISRSPHDAPTIASPGERYHPATTDFDLASVYSSPDEGELYLRYLLRRANRAAH